MPRGQRNAPVGMAEAKTKELLRLAKDLDRKRAKAAQAAQAWKDAEAAYRRALSEALPITPRAEAA